MNIQEPLFQYITFGRDDVHNNLEFIKNAMHNIEQQIVYMEEQGLGRRSDLDWEDTAARVRAYFEDIRSGLQRFGDTVDFSENNIRHLPRTTPAKKIVDDNDDLPF
jgi:hypothetical protein